jgi:hypothetical protein
MDIEASSSSAVLTCTAQRMVTQKQNKGCDTPFFPAPSLNDSDAQTTFMMTYSFSTHMVFSNCSDVAGMCQNRSLGDSWTTNVHNMKLLISTAFAFHQIPN